MPSLGRWVAAGVLIVVQAVAQEAAAEPAPDAPLRVRRFFADLEPYGTWSETADYGWCWKPAASIVGDHWVPYTRGQWILTDRGWTWISQEKWGSIVFHYGNWLFEKEKGWLWVPGETWVSAMVTWRIGPAHVAWAPTPPPGHKHRIAEADDLSRPGWTAVAPAHFLHHDAGPEEAGHVDAATLARKTTPMEGGPWRRVIEARSGHSFRAIPLAIVQSHTPVYSERLPPPPKTL